MFVGCVGPASNVFVLELEVGRFGGVYSSNHRQHYNEKNVLVARFRGTLLLAPPAAAAAND